MWVLLFALAQAAPEPSEHTIIYYNARMALREERPLEAVKLWLLRNALADRTGQVSVHDPDFHSVAWAALGDLGVCPDGLNNDEDGAGLWTIALHNYIVRNLGRRNNRKQPRPFDAFAVGRQARFVSITDVLSAKELSSVRLFRSRCLRPRVALASAGELVTANLSDRQVAARLMLYLLKQSRETMQRERIRGWASIEARVFDINLQLAALAAREARQKAREAVREGRRVGLSKESLAEMREEAPQTTLDPNSEAALILQDSIWWPIAEWMVLSPQRRLFVFDHARDNVQNPDKLDEIALGIIDELIVANEGAEVEKWIARYQGAPEVIWGEDRGRRLLALDAESGFQERSVIALHRGVRYLERGALSDALRSLAYAMQHAPESRSAEDVQNLSRRWLTYVSAQFEISDELLVTLRALVSRRDYSILLEDLMWRAALRADQRSFNRGIQGQIGRGALERRAALLTPLASGNVGRFLRRIREGLASSPSETMRFLKQMVQRLEREEAAVRQAHLPTLKQIRMMLMPLSQESGNTGRQSRAATELLAQTQAIIEGLEGLGVDAPVQDQARALAPGGEVFAGNIRLAPVDPLPWPFLSAEVPAPSIFSPIDLIPQEWRDADGERIFGWSLGG